MDKTLYQFNYSQDIVHLQTKFSLFNRVSNIVFSLTFDEDFDKKLMSQAIQLLVDRNDCLRLKFVKAGKETKQYFEDKRTIEEIPSKSFKTFGAMERFLHRFRKKAVNVKKGETFKAVYVEDPCGKKMIFVKISHMAADIYGIGIMVHDLNAIYNALKNRTELPPMPGKFEDILINDNSYRGNDDIVEKDRAFFKEYYEVKHPDRPEYCGIHGKSSDKWMNLKRKGAISLPYFFIKCDTRKFFFIIPSSITEKIIQWCTTEGISMNSFLFYTCALACSLKNDKAKYQLPLELLNCRGTIADKRAAGTKVQSLSVYTVVDYEKSFKENISAMDAEQKGLYRHTKLTYLEIQDIEHKLWNYSMLSQITNFCFSFIPFSQPKGMHLQIYSNGKGALPAYIALMLDVNTNEIHVHYDIQTQMCTPEQLIEFQNTYVNVIETVLKNPESKLDEVFQG